MSASLATYRLADGRIADARVGVGGAEPSPRPIPEAEAALNGQEPGDAAFRAAAEAASAAIDPLEDMQTTGEYRRDLVRAVVRRALEASVAETLAT
jgi:carbon-monoxide dehydrogenase medium subunit